MGRPRKNSEVPEPIPVCVGQDDEHLSAHLDDLDKASPHTTLKQGKYKAYTVKEKEDIIAESVTFGV